jgi:dTDP-L-rhamnose 4-epimerase
MSKQALITGGAGFVGSHLAEGLLNAGYDVRIFDELTSQVHPAGRPAYLSDDLELIVGDLRDPNRMRSALAGVDVVFHFAAAVGVGQSMYEISRYMSVNTQGTAELLQAILDTKMSLDKLIVASSMSIYGEGRYVCANCRQGAAPPVRSIEQLRAAQWDVYCDACGGMLKPIPTDETKPSEINSIYALSKRDQEQMCLIFGRTYGLPVTALRFFNIYGPRQALSNPYTGVAAVFASRMLNGKQPLIFEDGEQMRDFVHVADVVRANILAMKRSESNGHVINVGCSKPITIRRVAETLAKALEKEVLPVITNKFRAGDIRHCYADITKARTLLAYEPQVTHEEGFRELAAWLRGQKADDKAEMMLKELTTYGLTA